MDYSDLSYILNHLGEDRSQYFNSVAPPILQTSNFSFPDVESMRNQLLNEFDYHLYTRGNNPTTDILRKKIAALEGTEDALVLSSGSSAIACAIIASLNAGDHVICVRNPYIWTKKLLVDILPRFNINTTSLSFSLLAVAGKTRDSCPPQETARRKRCRELQNNSTSSLLDVFSAIVNNPPHPRICFFASWSWGLSL